jgi:UV DNA damage endonuclease
MNIRLGYVAMTLNLEDCSPSGTVTVAGLDKLVDNQTKLYRLRKVAKKNLENTLRILRYNVASDIYVYRLTSKLIPLATHASIEGWDYTEEFKNEFKEIGKFIIDNNLRISAHPDHFTLINSIYPKVVTDAVKDLNYHVNLYEAMGLSDYKYKLVIHVGGVYNDKIASTEKFKENFSKLPDRIRKRIILENDDKSYSATEVLSICQELRIPMVLDVHHYNCVNSGEKLEDLLPDIFKTWKNEAYPPKVHFSSPKGCKDFRSHSDFIDIDEFYKFLNQTKEIGRNFDIMLEAKAKDAALMKLSGDLSKLEDIEKINEAEFKIY